MRSSTSSSDIVSPEGPWLKTWLLTMTVVVTLVAGWEVTLRHMGHRPNVVDDEALWASQRARVYDRGGEKPIVLIGDCRIQLGLATQVLREEFPGHRIVQLAVQGTSPVATLRDLANDEKFDGIVLCGLNARLLCKDMWDSQQRYVDYYHQQYSLNVRVNRFFSTLAQGHLVSIDPQLRLNVLLSRLIEGQPWPAPYYLETHADRSRLADYHRVDVQAHQKWACDRIRWLSTHTDLPGVVEWLQDTMQVEEWVQRIHARGGRVVFLQLPSSGQLYTYEEFLFPKKEYWDAFAAQTSAMCIHFKDVPELAAFDCPDLSHLDRADAPRFTMALDRLLTGHDLLATPTDVMIARQCTGGPGNCICGTKGTCRNASAQCPCCGGAHPPGQDCSCGATSQHS